MELAHAQDRILAAFLEQGSLPEIAARVGMSLAGLADWAAAHTDLLAKLQSLLTTRCKLLAANLQCAALSALSAVSSSTTITDDPRLRERSLERQRKAASAILRHNTSARRTTSASPGPDAPASLDASMPRASMPSSSRQSSPRKASIADRLAARRLSALNAT